MRSRVMSALIAAPLVLAIVAVGGTCLTVMVTGLGIAAVVEFYRLGRGSGFQPSATLGAVGVAALAVAGHLGSEMWLGAILAGLVIASLTLQIITAGRSNAVANPAVTVFGASYVGWALATFLLLRRLGGPSAGLGHVVSMLLAVWATDIGAYFLGSAFGRHKLVPDLSPNKSVEGAVFGLVAGAVTGVGVRSLGATLGWWPGVPIWHAAILAAMASAAGQAGDLAESAMKRNAKVKDSGVFMPGHGGVLDRIDSVLFAIPVVYYYVRLLLQ
ncbi:MAG: phosphatidate cytidylyltransferase [Bacillota bacterium]